MLSWLTPLLSIMSEIPAGNGNAVPNGSVSGGAAPKFPGLHGVSSGGAVSSPGGASEGATAVPAVAPTQSGQPSPQDANIAIEDTRFYLTDPNNPESRLVGVQLREAIQRGRQVDTLQSQLHTTQNLNKTLSEQLEAASARLKEYETEAAVAAQLTRMGVSSPASGQQQVGVPNPQGTQPQQQSYLDMANQINAGEGTAAAYGFGTDPGVGTVDPAQQQTQGNPPVPEGQNSVFSDPQELAKQLLPVLDQLVAARVGNIQEQVQQQTQAGLDNMRQERAVQDQIGNTLQATRQVRAQALANLGIADDSSRNILDLEDMSAVLQREAEGLIGLGGQQNVALAQDKLRQAATMQQQAVNDRVQAQISFNNTQRQRQFDTQIENAPFAALSVEETTEPNYDLRGPREIAAANQAKLNKALELVEARSRIDGSTGQT